MFYPNFVQTLKQCLSCALFEEATDRSRVYVDVSGDIFQCEFFPMVVYQETEYPGNGIIKNISVQRVSVFK